MHLTRTDRCLRRVAAIIPPFSIPEIVEAEAAGKSQLQVALLWARRSLLYWSRAPPPPPPRVSLMKVPWCCQSLQDRQVTQWIEEYLSQRNVEGPGTGAISFRDRRPSSTARA